MSIDTIVNSLRGLAYSALALGAAGCASPDPGACVASHAQPLFSGSSEPQQLALDDSERAAIGMVESDPPNVVCTGVVFAKGWVISAAHCDLGDRLRFRPSAENSQPLQIVSSVIHPELDLALLELEPSAAADALVPIPLSTRRVDNTWIGTEATLAGVGLTEGGTLGALLFLDEPIVALDASSLTVDGAGASGACVGDSGGPLLIAAEDGSARIAGVLSVGSADCLGIDVYTRVDGIQTWIAEASGAPDATCSTAP